MSNALDLATIWKPLPTQQAFLDAIAQAPDLGMVAYVGAFGAGKTWAICRAALGVALADPGTRILVGRFFSTDLRDTTQALFFEMVDELEQALRRQYPSLDSKSIVGDYAKQANEFSLPNGSVILFRPLDEAEKKYKSLNINAFLVDEGSEVPLPAMMMLQSRIRRGGRRRFGAVVSNPTSTRHWLYEWFVRDPRTGVPLPDHVLFRTKTSENQANLPLNYIPSMMAKYSEDWVRLYLDGEWGEIRTGQRPVFPTFHCKDHVGPTSWLKKKPVFVGIDWGYKNPGVVWAQTDAENKLLIHRTWFPKEIHSYGLGEGIKKRNGEWFPSGDFYYFAGWDGTKKHDSAEKSSVEILRGMGISVKLVYSHIERGLTLIRNFMDPRDDGSFGLVVNPVNERLIEGFMGGYHYEPVKGQIMSREDISAVKEVPAEDGLYDQLIDALRYVVVSVFDTPSAAPRSSIQYGYRKASTPKRNARRSVPSVNIKPVGLYVY